jgi:hypothetical protein
MRVKKAIKDSLIRCAGALRIHTAERTPYTDVGQLIAALRPYDPGIELIRLGPDGDGGYLVPDDLDGIEYAFSPGVSTESGFEVELAERGIGVFLADASVEGPARPHPRFVFDKKFLGCISDERYMTLEEWKRTRLPDYDGDLLMQMDIEGAEFETLFDAPAALLAQFRIMVIEFHALQNLLNRPYFALISHLFRKILATHSVVHIHPNNCCGAVKAGGFVIPRVAEFTFLRNDRFKKRELQRRFPHPLDRNNTRKATLLLHECWYR